MIHNQKGCTVKNIFQFIFHLIPNNINEIKSKLTDWELTDTAVHKRVPKVIKVAWNPCLVINKYVTDIYVY